MSKELTQQLAEIRQELEGVELSIEQYADQDDTDMVEYYVEQQRYLKTKIKLYENELS